MAQNEASLLIRIKEAGADVLDKISGGIKSMADTAMAAGVAIVGFGAAAISAFKEEEQAVNALSQSMVQQGIFTTKLRKEYTDMAIAIQGATTFADDQVIAAQATIQAYIGQTKITKELVEATADFAAAKGIDLKSAAEALGKAIGGETNALARYGVEVDTTATKSERMAQVIEGVTAKFGGQAEAAARNLGSMDQLKNSLSDVLETVGEKLAPFIAFFTKQLNDFSIALKTNSNFAQGLEDIIKFLAQTFSIAKNAVLGLAESIGVGLGGAVAAVGQALDGEFSQAKETMGAALTEIKDLALERKAAMDAELAALDEQKALTEEAKRQEDLRLFTQSEMNKSTVALAEKQKREKIATDQAKKEAEIEKAKNAEMTKNKADTLNTISTLQNSNNKALAIAGKAAGITQIAIETPVAISKALSAFPPPFNFAAAGLVGAAMAAQAARIAGVQLAEGGIVRATPGGIQATIGEGGKDEAVIPLDSGEAQSRLGGGQNVTIYLNGPIMGNEEQAMELARAIDRSLLKLRQSNQSVAFETDVF